MPTLSIPQYVEIVNVDSKAHTFTDPGLFEIGGSITIEAGARAKVPYPTFCRLIRSPYLKSAETHDLLARMKAEEAIRVADITETAEVEKPRTGRRAAKKEDEDA